MRVVGGAVAIIGFGLVFLPLFIPYDLKRSIAAQTDRNFRIYFLGTALVLLGAMLGD